MKKSNDSKNAAKTSKSAKNTAKNSSNSAAKNPQTLPSFAANNNSNSTPRRSYSAVLKSRFDSPANNTSRPSRNILKSGQYFTFFKLFTFWFANSD